MRDALRAIAETTATELFAASRDHGTVGENKPAPWGGLDGKKTWGHGRIFFSILGDAPTAHEVFMELIAHLDGMVRTITVNQGRFFEARFIGASRIPP
jgi:hypothetical protein